MISVKTIVSPKSAPVNILFLYNKQLQIITGKSEKACYRMIEKIRAKYGKETGIPITLDEFCDYTRLRPELVKQLLRPVSNNP